MKPSTAEDNLAHAQISQQPKQPGEERAYNYWELQKQLEDLMEEKHALNLKLIDIAQKGYISLIMSEDKEG